MCHPKRINRHRVFQGLAKRGRSTKGWFYGFKLHLIINECGELLSFHLTAGNVDDHKPVPSMAQGLWGKLFGDKGYISMKLLEELAKDGLRLITAVRENMKNRLLCLEDKLLLRKRSVIETVNDQVKNISELNLHFKNALMDLPMIGRVDTCDSRAKSFLTKKKEERFQFITFSKAR